MTHITTECNEWLEECLKVFPKLKRRDIVCNYKKMSKRILEMVKGRVSVTRDLDPEMLLLKDVVRTKTKKKIHGNLSFP